MRHIFIDHVSGFFLGTNEIKVDTALELTSRPSGASQVALVVNNQPANAGDLRDTDSIPRSVRCPGGGHGNPPVFLPRESHGQRNLVGYSPLCCKESDMTVVT